MCMSRQTLEEVSNPLELELLAVVNRHVGIEN